VKRCALVFVAAIACARPAVPGQADERRYTSIRRRDCTSPADLRATFAARQLGVQACRGVGDWRVLLVASQENTWIELRSSTVMWSGEQAIVYDAPIGMFPTVGSSPRVEWRVDRRGVPTALIVRVSATSRTDQKTRVSRLFVVRLEQDRACVVGRVRTNDEARALADGPTRCAREP
jgi:hypothetical protein